MRSTKKANSKKRTVTRRPRAKRNPFAYQILASTPGNPYRSIGAFPASSQAEALKMAENELKRKGRWTAGTKLIAGAVPLNSVAGRRQKNKTIIKAKKAVVIAPNPKRRKNAEKLIAKYFVANGWKFGILSTLTPGKYSWSLRSYKSREAALRAGRRELGIQPQKRASNPKPSKARKIREDFTGMRSTKTAVMNAPKGTPAALAKLGRLVSIKTRQRTIKPAVKNPAAAVWLCADEKGRLHLCTAADRLIEGPKQDFGEVIEVEYQTAKPHLGHKNPTIFFHKMGEEGGQRPRLVSDGQGGLRFVGGGYRLSPEGIID